MQKITRTATLAAAAVALVAAPLVAGTAANASVIGCPGGAQGQLPGCELPGDGGGLEIGLPGGAGGAIG